MIYPIKQERPCMDPNHNPPMFISLPQGYAMDHICPTCGKKQTIMNNAGLNWGGIELERQGSA